MKRIAHFILLLLLAVSASAQEQGTHSEIHYSSVDDVRAGSPIDVTKEYSETNLELVVMYFENCDRLTRLVFKGYNPGKEIKRHLTVKITEDKGRNPAVIFDGDYTIPHGGTADNRIPLLAIDFSYPLVVDSYYLFLNITCTGEPVETPIYFEQQVSNYSGEDVCHPTCTLTLQYDVVYYNGTVTDSNGNPVAGAEVSVFGSWERAFKGFTDENGKCCIKLDHPYASYRLMVNASGYPAFVSDNFRIVEHFPYLTTKTPTNIVLRDKLTFTAGKQATIILPRDPDPSWGRYYSFKERKPNTARDSFYFEREYHPKAYKPYVIFPAKDFSLNFSDYDLPVPDISSGRDVVVFGEHPESNEYPSPGLWGALSDQPPSGRISWKYIVFAVLDSTLDCTIKGTRRVGTCRAYLVGGDGIFPKFFFLDSQGGETGIDETVSTEPDTDPYYDLQGRRLTGLPKKGLYIRNRRKIVVR